MKKIFLVALCIILTVCVFVACDNGKDDVASTDSEQETTQDATSDVENNSSESVDNVETTDAEESTDTDNNGDESLPVEPVVYATSVTLNKNSLSLIKGGSEALIATVAPTNATDKSVTWTTSDANVATVNNGTVTAVGAGTATVTATTANGKTATCEVTVSVLAAGVTLSKTEATVNLGDSLTLTATVNPSDTTDQAITWKSSDTSVATVVNGVVSTLKTGSATITATTSNGKSASCVVTVKSNAVIQYELTADCSFYVVTGITGRTNELEIPFLHDGLRVVAIKAGAFEGNTDIQNIILPNSIEHIYDNAFKNCVNLHTINLPNSLIHIGVSAFEECASLKSVTIPYLVKTVSDKAFYHCTSLETVTVIAEPEELERTIGTEAFSECTSLKTVTIGNSVETIGTKSFARCTSLENVRVGDGLKTIGVGAFDYCTSLISFEMPDTVTTIGHMAFRHAEALKTINFSKKLTAIGNACFQYCVSLDNVELHGGIVSIGESCFSFCSGMKNLRILGDITTLGDSSFYECTRLTNVYFASSISKDLGINNYVFYNAGTLGGGITLTLSPDACIPDRLFEPQEDQNRPKLVKLIVEDGATKVNYFIKYNDLPYLASIELPDSITDIKNGTFDNTAWYKAQPDGALYIGNVFYGYKGTLDGELTISDDTVCIAFGALKDQKPTKLTVPFVGAVLNGSQNTHFGYIFGAESAAGQGEIIPAELISVKVTKCQYEISDTAFIGCEFTVDIEHHWSDWNITTPETCLAVGEEARSCSVCENTEKRERAIADHTYTNLHKTENVHWYSCAVNGCSAETAVQEHQWGEWQVTVESNCISVGSRYRACSVCEHTVTETLAIVPDAHSWNNENTCTYCSVYKDSGVVFTFNESTSTYSITDYTGSVDSVIIPSTYKGYAVTSIGDYAFENCTDLTSVTIPSSVTSIGYYAFDGCDGLTSITLPFVGATKDGTSNTHFGYIFGAYGYSYNDDYVPASLKTVMITGGTSIGDRAFYNCSGLTSITIPDSVESIGNDAFYGCTGLTSITIPDSVTSIGDSAFGHCTGLTSVTIGNGVESIGEWAFSGCTGLTSVTIGNGVTSIGDVAFVGCTGLTSITIPDSVTSIGELTFRNCTGLTSVYITDIAAWCGILFDDEEANPLCCANNLYLNGELVTDLVIPDSVTSIGNYAFYDYKELTSVTIPDSVTRIGSYAFSGCKELTSITFNGTKDQWNAISKRWDWNYNVPTTKVVCTDGEVAI